jgi:hypothetical protein
MTHYRPTSEQQFRAQSEQQFRINDPNWRLTATAANIGLPIGIVPQSILSQSSTSLFPSSSSSSSQYVVQPRATSGGSGGSGGSASRRVVNNIQYVSRDVNRGNQSASRRIDPFSPVRQRPVPEFLARTFTPPAPAPINQSPLEIPYYPPHYSISLPLPTQPIHQSNVVRKSADRRLQGPGPLDVPPPPLRQVPISPPLSINQSASRRTSSNPLVIPLAPPPSTPSIPPAKQHTTSATLKPVGVTVELKSSAKRTNLEDLADTSSKQTMPATPTTTYNLLPPSGLIRGSFMEPVMKAYFIEWESKIMACINDPVFLKQMTQLQTSVDYMNTEVNTNIINIRTEMTDELKRNGYDVDHKYDGANEQINDLVQKRGRWRLLKEQLDWLTSLYQKKIVIHQSEIQVEFAKIRTQVTQQTVKWMSQSPVPTQLEFVSLWRSNLLMANGQGSYAYKELYVDYLEDNILYIECVFQVITLRAVTTGLWDSRVRAKLDVRLDEASLAEFSKVDTLISTKTIVEARQMPCGILSRFIPDLEILMKQDEAVLQSQAEYIKTAEIKWETMKEERTDDQLKNPLLDNLDFYEDVNIDDDDDDDDDKGDDADTDPPFLKELNRYFKDIYTKAITVNKQPFPYVLVHQSLEAKGEGEATKVLDYQINLLNSHVNSFRVPKNRAVRLVYKKIFRQFKSLVSQNNTILKSTTDKLRSQYLEIAEQKVLTNKDLTKFENEINQQIVQTTQWIISQSLIFKSDDAFIDRFQYNMKRIRNTYSSKYNTADEDLDNAITRSIASKMSLDWHYRRWVWDLLLGSYFQTVSILYDGTFSTTLPGPAAADDTIGGGRKSHIMIVKDGGTDQDIYLRFSNKSIITYSHSIVYQILSDYKWFRETVAPWDQSMYVYWFMMSIIIHSIFEFTTLASSSRQYKEYWDQTLQLITKSPANESAVQIMVISSVNTMKNMLWTRTIVQRSATSSSTTTTTTTFTDPSWIDRFDTSFSPSLDTIYLRYVEKIVGDQSILPLSGQKLTTALAQAIYESKSDIVMPSRLNYVATTIVNFPSTFKNVLSSILQDYNDPTKDGNFAGGRVVIFNTDGEEYYVHNRWLIYFNNYQFRQLLSSIVDYNVWVANHYNLRIALITPEPTLTLTLKPLVNQLITSDVFRHALPLLIMDGKLKLSNTVAFYLQKFLTTAVRTLADWKSSSSSSSSSPAVGSYDDTTIRLFFTIIVQSQPLKRVWFLQSHENISEVIRKREYELDWLATLANLVPVIKFVDSSRTNEHYYESKNTVPYALSQNKESDKAERTIISKRLDPAFLLYSLFDNVSLYMTFMPNPTDLPQHDDAKTTLPGHVSNIGQRYQGKGPTGSNTGGNIKSGVKRYRIHSFYEAFNPYASWIIWVDPDSETLIYIRSNYSSDPSLYRKQVNFLKRAILESHKKSNWKHVYFPPTNIDSQLNAMSDPQYHDYIHNLNHSNLLMTLFIYLAYQQKSSSSSSSSSSSTKINDYSQPLTIGGRSCMLANFNTRSTMNEIYLNLVATRWFAMSNRLDAFVDNTNSTAIVSILDLWKSFMLSLWTRARLSIVSRIIWLRLGNINTIQMRKLYPGMYSINPVIITVISAITTVKYQPIHPIITKIITSTESAYDFLNMSYSNTEVRRLYTIDKLFKMLSLMVWIDPNSAANPTSDFIIYLPTLVVPSTVCDDDESELIVTACYEEFSKLYYAPNSQLTVVATTTSGSPSPPGLTTGEPSIYDRISRWFYAPTNLLTETKALSTPETKSIFPQFNINSTLGMMSSVMLLSRAKPSSASAAVAPDVITFNLEECPSQWSVIMKESKATPIVADFVAVMITLSTDLWITHPGQHPLPIQHSIYQLSSKMEVLNNAYYRYADGRCPFIKPRHLNKAGGVLVNRIRWIMSYPDNTTNVEKRLDDKTTNFWVNIFNGNLQAIHMTFGGGDSKNELLIVHDGSIRSTTNQSEHKEWNILAESILTDPNFASLSASPHKTKQIMPWNLKQSESVSDVLFLCTTLQYDDSSYNGFIRNRDDSRTLGDVLTSIVKQRPDAQRLWQSFWDRLCILLDTRFPRHVYQITTGYSESLFERTCGILETQSDFKRLLPTLSAMAEDGIVSSDVSKYTIAQSAILFHDLNNQVMSISMSLKRMYLESEIGWSRIRDKLTIIGNARIRYRFLKMIRSFIEESILESSSSSSSVSKSGLLTSIMKTMNTLIEYIQFRKIHPTTSVLVLAQDWISIFIETWTLNINNNNNNNNNQNKASKSSLGTTTSELIEPGRFQFPITIDEDNIFKFFGSSPSPPMIRLKNDRDRTETCFILQQIRTVLLQCNQYLMSNDDQGKAFMTHVHSTLTSSPDTFNFILAQDDSMFRNMGYNLGELRIAISITGTVSSSYIQPPHAFTNEKIPNIPDVSNFMVVSIRDYRTSSSSSSSSSSPTSPTSSINPVKIFNVIVEFAAHGITSKTTTNDVHVIANLPGPLPSELYSLIVGQIGENRLIINKKGYNMIPTAASKSSENEISFYLAQLSALNPLIDWMSLCVALSNCKRNKKVKCRFPITETIRLLATQFDTLTKYELGQSWTCYQWQWMKKQYILAKFQDSSISFPTMLMAIPMPPPPYNKVEPFTEDVLRSIGYDTTWSAQQLSAFNTRRNDFYFKIDYEVQTRLNLICQILVDTWISKYTGKYNGDRKRQYVDGGVGDENDDNNNDDADVDVEIKSSGGEEKRYPVKKEEFQDLYIHSEVLKHFGNRNDNNGTNNDYMNQEYMRVQQEVNWLKYLWKMIRMYYNTIFIKLASYENEKGTPEQQSIDEEKEKEKVQLLYTIQQLEVITRNWYKQNQTIDDISRPGKLNESITTFTKMIASCIRSISSTIETESTESTESTEVTEVTEATEATEAKQKVSNVIIYHGNDDEVIQVYVYSLLRKQLLMIDQKLSTHIKSIVTSSATKIWTEYFLYIRATINRFLSMVTPPSRQSCLRLLTLILTDGAEAISLSQYR